MSASFGLPLGSQPTTHLGQRLGWTVALLAALALVGVLLRRGWLARAAGQNDVPAPPAVPVALGPERARAEGTYVSTTRTGDWLERIVVHGLGVRGPATVTVHDAGVLLCRNGGLELFIPAPALSGTRREAGMAGKFVGRPAVLVFTWRHGSCLLDTGFHPAAGGLDRLETAVGALARRC